MHRQEEELILKSYGAGDPRWMARLTFKLMTFSCIPTSKVGVSRFHFMKFRKLYVSWIFAVPGKEFNHKSHMESKYLKVPLLAEYIN